MALPSIEFLVRAVKWPKGYQEYHYAGRICDTTSDFRMGFLITLLVQLEATNPRTFGSVSWPLLEVFLLM